MATKRQLKKAVRNTCGALAAEIIFARAAFPSIDRKNVHDIIVEIAGLQSDTLTKASIAFDKAPRDYENKAEYNKARRTYFNTAYTNLLDCFDKAVVEIVKKMNAALPDEVRQTIKEAASK